MPLVNEIAKSGLAGKEDMVLLFRELINSFPSNYWKDAGEDDICDFVRYFESETDRIAKTPEEKSKYSAEELKEQAEYEEYALNLNKEEITKVLTKLSKVDF